MLQIHTKALKQWPCPQPAAHPSITAKWLCPRPHTLPPWSDASTVPWGLVTTTVSPFVLPSVAPSRIGILNSSVSKADIPVASTPEGNLGTGCWEECGLKDCLCPRTHPSYPPLITLEAGFVPTLCDLNPSAFSNGNIFIPSGILGEPHSIQLPSAQCPGKGTCGVGARARSFGKDRASPTPALPLC